MVDDVVVEGDVIAVFDVVVVVVGGGDAITGGGDVIAVDGVGKVIARPTAVNCIRYLKIF